MKTRFLTFFSTLALLSNLAYGQNIGVGTNTPQEKLHVAGTLRVDDLQTSAPATATTDKVVWVDANGKVYSFPAGSAGKLLGVNGAGLLAWLDPGLANTLNNGQIWIGDATNLPVAQTPSGDATISNTGVITIQDDAVDGTDISISAESNGSLMYFDGTNWVNLGIGAAGQILSISGGVPTWVNPAAAPTTGDLTTTTSGVTITGGTGAVFGAGTTVNVATSALGQNGLVTGPTAANGLQVWGTDALGNPGWVAVSTLLTTNDVLAGAANNAVSITNGTNQVVGATDLTVNVATNALTQDGVVTGTTAANITDVWATDATGAPAWRDPNSVLTTSDIVAGAGNNAVSITNGTGQIVGGVNATVNVATNALNQAGVVTGTTAANANQVWGTDALGNPAWITPTNDDWHITGNTGTTPATNFLGTLDNQPIAFRTNNIEKMRLVDGNVANGLLGVGLPSLPAATFTSIDPFATIMALGNGSNHGDIVTATAGNTAYSGYYVSTKARGSLTTPTVVQQGDLLSAFEAWGYDGTAYRVGTGIYSVVEATAAANDMPSALTFSTTPDGSVATTERMRITNAGDVGIGIAVPLAKTDIQVNSLTTYPHLRLLETGNDYARLNYMNTNSATKYWASAAYINAADDNLSKYNIWYGSTFTDIMTVTGSNRVGINVAQNPISIFDVNGDIAMREGTAITAVNGANNNIVLPLNATYGGEHSHYRITGPAAAFSITGIAGGNNGQVLTLINASTQTMTIANANAGSLAANRIQTGYGNDITIGTGGSVTMVYNPTLTIWEVTAHSGANTGKEWNLTGNAGTNPTNNFVGTTDNQNLIFRTNNTEKVRVSTAGTIGLGIATGIPVVGTNYIDPWSRIEVLGDGFYGDILQHTAGNTYYGNWHTNYKARGTHSAPLIVANGDQIAMYNSFAYDGAAYQYATYINSEVDGVPGANDMPSRMTFGTTPDGTAGILERMRISNAGAVAINNTAPTATDRLQVVSGTTMNGMLLTSQQTTAGSYGFRNNATFAAGGATVYTGYNGTIAIAGGTSTNAAVFADVANGTAPAGVFSTNGTNTNAALIGTSTVWNGANIRSSLASANALVGVNTAASGTSTGSGIYGQTTQRDGVGIYGFNNGPAGTSLGWVFGLSRASVFGDGTATGSYSFGVMGDGGTTIRSGGVFGDDYGLARGALGYYAANGLDYGVYGFGAAYQTGLTTGRLAGNNENQTASMENEPNNMVGLGIYGGVMGGWIRGMHYGMHAKGTEYGMYVDGNSITNKPTIQLMETGKETRAMSFAPSAMSADVYTRGNVTLKNGTAFVAFSEDFSLSISQEIPLNITVTPTGNSKGVYVTEVTSKGFRIVENENGTSSVSVNWVAYGTRAGYENPQEMLSPEILSADFDKNMDAVMYNENNTEGQSKGIWFDGEKVQTGETPASFQAAKMAKVRTREVPNADITNPNPPRNVNRVNNDSAPQVIGTSDLPAEVLEKMIPKRTDNQQNEMLKTVKGN